MERERGWRQFGACHGGIAQARELGCAGRVRGIGGGVRVRQRCRPRSSITWLGRQALTHGVGLPITGITDQRQVFQPRRGCWPGPRFRRGRSGVFVGPAKQRRCQPRPPFGRDAGHTDQGQTGSPHDKTEGRPAPWTRCDPGPRCGWEYRACRALKLGRDGARGGRFCCGLILRPGLVRGPMRAGWCFRSAVVPPVLRFWPFGRLLLLLHASPSVAQTPNLKRQKTCQKLSRAWKEFVPRG